MRKALLSSVAATAMILGADAARADDPAALDPYWYVTLFGGIGSLHDVAMTHDGYLYNTNFNTGFTVGAAVGTELAPGLRGELEFSYQRYNAKDYTYIAGQPPVFADGPADLYFFLANVWKDLDLGHAITPYVGLGVGLGVADIDVEHIPNNEPDLNDSGVGLAAQLGAGIRMALSDRMSLDLSYRFRALATTTILGDRSDADDHGKMSWFTHAFQAGLSLDLGGPKSSDLRTLSGLGGEDWYVSLFAGATFPEDVGFETYSYVYNHRMKDGFTVGAALGTYVAPGLRGELEFAYQNYASKDYTPFAGFFNIPETGDVDLYFVLANLWKDIELGLPVTPYIGGGLGVGLVTTDDGDLFRKGDVEIGLAGQFGVGFRFVTDGRWVFDAGYRFRGVVDATLYGDPNVFTPHHKASFYTHTLQVGASYHFGNPPQTPEPAAATDPDGSDWYASLFAGVVAPEDSGITNYAYVDNVSFRTGYTIGVAVGTEVAEGLRGELELSYMNYAAKDYNYQRTQPKLPVGGDVDLYFILANLWKDFDLGNGFMPYIGGGIGIGIANVELTHPFLALDDTATGLAGQLGAGIRFALTDRLTADAGYRFKGIVDATVKGNPSVFAPHGKMSLYNHSFIGGLAWGF